MKKIDRNRLEYYGDDLRGEPQNRYGGHKVQKLRAFRGNTYGAANVGRIYTDEERKVWGAANGYPTK